ncbi:hypothetical protein LCGC14_1197750 [marine sediment metagenome]|uniref:Rad50/SbcC-type AAA domain-containing protein n=1 Tax=marine sediment metagenome TaxID=412755 RepID=A0A0F9LM98_9ZZZZ
MSVRFTQLWIKDFGCIGEAVIDLSEPGLVFVTGKNNDSAAATSNGSGKSTVWNALTWVLYEMMVNGDKADTMIRRGAKKASVALGIERAGGVSLKVARTRRKGSTKLAIFDGDGNQIKASKAEAQAIIEDAVGLDFNSFRNTVLYGQNDSARFADPGTTDGQRKDMLRRLLKTTVYQDCYELACDRRVLLKKGREEQESKAEIARSRLSEYDLESLQDDFDGWAAERSGRVDRYIAAARERKEHAESFERDDSRLDELTAERDAAREKVAGWDSEDDLEKLQNQQLQLAGETGRLNSDVISAERDSKRLGRELENLSGGTCPVCTAPLSSGAPKEFREGLRDQANEGEEEIRRRVELRKASKEKEADLHLKLLMAGSAKNEHNDAERDALRLDAEVTRETAVQESIAGKVERAIEQARDAVAKAQAARAERNPYEIRLGTAKERIAEVEAEVVEADERVKAYAGDMALTEFWVRGFSGQGLPSLLLDSCMPVLTDRANHYLRTLADGDIAVEFNTQRELKSREGEMRDQIAVTWTIEGYEGVTPSGGQLKKISIAVDLALMDLAASREGEGVSLLALDEVLDGLDAEGRSRVLILLKELRSARGVVYVTSHEPDVSTVFERVLVVEKTGGVATVKEVA